MTSSPSSKKLCFEVGEIWQGPTGAQWLVTHRTSDGQAELRAATGRMRTLRKPAQASRGWQRLALREH